MRNGDRARGVLFGLAVGDALGTTQEFARPAAPRFPEAAVGPQREPVGRGPFSVAPGQVTDDTHLACCLAASLRRQGRFAPEDVARRYVEWMRVTFDIGSTTAGALGHLRAGTPPLEAGRVLWAASRRPKPAANGSLMRTAPVGVFFAEDPEARRRAALDDSAITHYDPRCRLACAAFDAAVAAALVSERAPVPAELAAAAGAELEASAAVLGDEHPEDRRDVDAARADLARDLEFAVRSDPELYGPELHLHRHEGFVRVAFRLAFWELLHRPDYASALLDVVNRGGDADTNGAITGALLGACHGEAGIPAGWRSTVLDALQDGPASPWRDAYHPRRLLELLDPR